jgi:hypothetical protein
MWRQGSPHLPGDHDEGVKAFYSASLPPAWLNNAVRVPGDKEMVEQRGSCRQRQQRRGSFLQLAHAVTSKALPPVSFAAVLPALSARLGAGDMLKYWRESFLSAAVVCRRFVIASSEPLSIFRAVTHG